MLTNTNTAADTFRSLAASARRDADYHNTEAAKAGRNNDPRMAHWHADRRDEHLADADRLEATTE